MEIKTILTQLIKANNFKFLNVTGAFARGKHYNIIEAVNELGLKHLTLEMASLSFLDLVLPGENVKLKIEDNSVLILSDLDRTETSLYDKVIDGITRGNLFGLDLEKFTLIITSQEHLDVDLALANRSVFVENK